MKRLSGVALLLAMAGGCMSTEGNSAFGVYMSHAFNNRPDGGDYARTPVNAPGCVGPYGAPVAMTAPASTGSALSGEAYARYVFAQSLPPEVVQQVDYKINNGGSGILQAQALVPPGSGAVPPGMQAGPNGMPVMLPGAISPPGVPAPPAGPALPGMPGGPPAAVAGAVAAVGALTGGGAAPFCAQRTEIRFIEPKGMKVSWFAPKPDGKPGFGANFLDVPGRYNFLQAAVYRLKLSEIPGFPGLELYPTLEVVPANGKTATFLAHSAVPISFTLEDLDQVRAGNYVVKVIYLPDPQFQDLAATGPDEVVSSRLEPGVDPITEALRRGSILAVVRLGNIDLEAPNTPAMDAPGPMSMMPQPRMPAMAGMPGMPGMMMPGPGMAGRMAPYAMPNGLQQMLPNPFGGQQIPTMLPPAMGPNGAQQVPAIPTGKTPNGPVSMAPTGSATNSVAAH
jgi:hypothetical protein